MRTSDSAPAIVWFRQDLRLSDNPALCAAAAGGRTVICVYILDNAGDWPMGGASRWWLHQSLLALRSDLRARGGDLILRRGPAGAALSELAAETGARAIFWNRCYEPWAVARDTAAKNRFKAEGIEVRSFNAGLLFEPWSIQTKAGEPYKVFSAFWRACAQAGEPEAPLPPPDVLSGLGRAIRSEMLDSWALTPATPDWAGGLQDAWSPGEIGARDRLDAFLGEAISRYRADRDRPDRPHTSKLSPHLHFGEIGPRQVWRATQVLAGHTPDAEKFLTELGWREFSHHLLFHFPTLPERNLRAAFDAFPWADDPAGLEAWRRGHTGYPIVDAGMRELWTTGWMHNRVRMITASFLVKDLLLPWQAGEAWFWDTLVDADLSANAASWQWVAGSGADAAPYFRIFNPVLQGEKFDPDGAYVRRWVPELTRVPPTWIHKPWLAPQALLTGVGVRLGADYPRPIVDHGVARDRALAAFATIKGGSDPA